MWLSWRRSLGGLYERAFKSCDTLRFVSRDGGQQGRVHGEDGRCKCRADHTLHVLGLSPGRRRTGQRRLKTSLGRKLVLRERTLILFWESFCLETLLLSSMTLSGICLSFYSEMGLVSPLLPCCRSFEQMSRDARPPADCLCPPPLSLPSATRVH